MSDNLVVGKLESYFYKPSGSIIPHVKNILKETDEYTKEDFWKDSYESEFGKDSKIVKDFFKQGHSKGKSPLDFDIKEIRRGLKIELEHTNNEIIAMKIVMDHLSEDPDYYIKLSRVILDD